MNHKYYKRMLQNKDFIIFENVRGGYIRPIYLSNKDYFWWRNALEDRTLLDKDDYRSELFPMSEEEFILDVL